MNWHDKLASLVMFPSVQLGLRVEESTSFLHYLHCQFLYINNIFYSFWFITHVLLSHFYRNNDV